MQVNSKGYIWKYLVISLLAVVAMWAAGYFSGQNAATLSSDFAYIPLTIILSITALFQVYQLRKKQENVVAWHAFVVFAVLYCIAQHIWALNELLLDNKPFPSLADVAFIISTISLILFFMLIINSKKQFISRRMYTIAIPSGCFVAALSAYLFMSSNPGLTLDQILLVLYPILDGIALVPALIGIMMHLRGKLDFATCLICLSMIPLTIADILFQVMTTNGTYYSGSIADLLYYIQITLLIFGVYIISNSKIRSNVSMSQN